MKAQSKQQIAQVKYLCFRVIVITDNHSCLPLFGFEEFIVMLALLVCLLKISHPWYDITTIKHNSVNSPLSVFKCLLISSPEINHVKRYSAVCLSSLKCCCCTATRARSGIHTENNCEKPITEDQIFIFAEEKLRIVLI